MSAIVGTGAAAFPQVAYIRDPAAGAGLPFRARALAPRVDGADFTAPGEQAAPELHSDGGVARLGVAAGLHPWQAPSAADVSARHPCSCHMQANAGRCNGHAAAIAGKPKSMRYGQHGPAQPARGQHARFCELMQRRANPAATWKKDQGLAPSPWPQRWREDLSCFLASHVSEAGIQAVAARSATALDEALACC